MEAHPAARTVGPRRFHTPEEVVMAVPILASHTLVADVMRPGILSCPPDSLVREVARIMAVHRVHCVVVSGLRAGDRTVWGVVSDLDLASAVESATEDTTAGEIAATEAVTLPRTATLDEAARLMAQHETAHVVIVDERSGDPLGVVSTLDVALALAGLAPNPVAGS
jgi:CBS domain-containing protein